MLVLWVEPIALDQGISHGPIDGKAGSDCLGAADFLAMRANTAGSAAELRVRPLSGKADITPLASPHGAHGRHPAMAANTVAKAMAVSAMCAANMCSRRVAPPRHSVSGTKEIGRGSPFEGIANGREEAE